MATTGVCDSWKQEVLEAGHCFNATQSNVAVSNVSGTNTLTITNAPYTQGLAVGMDVSGTGAPASPGNVVIGFPAYNQVQLSGNTAAAMTQATFNGDTFKMLLIGAAPAHIYDHTQTNVGTPGTGTPSTSNVGTDETTGAGYASGGITLGNVQPSLPGNPSTTATLSFSPNPSWSGATFSCTAGIVYNTSTRLGGSAAPLNGRSCSVHDFGGTQTVSSGTLTVLMPTNDGSNALIRIS